MSSTVFFFVAAACNENLGMRETSQVATTPRAFAGAGAFDEAIGGWDDASKTMDTKVSAVRKDIGGWYTSSLTHAEVIYDIQTFDEAIGGSDRSKMAEGAARARRPAGTTPRTSATSGSRTSRTTGPPSTRASSSSSPGTRARRSSSTSRRSAKPTAGFDDDLVDQDLDAASTSANFAIARASI